MSQPEQYLHRDDEISLVDLATTFVRRRNVFFVVFALVVIAGLVYFFTSDNAPAAKYVTTLKLAQLPVMGEEPDDPKERVATLIATIESRWLPQVQAMHSEQEQNGPVPIKIESVQGTDLVRLSTSGVHLNSQNVEAAHELLTRLIVENQNDQLARLTGLLEAQVASLNDVIANHSADSVVAAQSVETRVHLQQKIATGEAPEVLSLARKSEGGKNGPSAKLILGLVFVLGGMLGIFSAFMAEFISNVRKAMKAMKENA